MIKIQDLKKTYHTSDGEVEALKNVSMDIEDGDIYGVIGMSGAGKSTLVRCINMLERPDEGSIIIDGVDMGALNEKQLRAERKHIAMIFQNFDLLMQRSVLKNVCFPLELEGTKKNEAEARALELLDIVGLKDKASVYPAQLSGGQQQRVAIARALAMDPKLLLCDEATSALDPTTTNSILELIRDINNKLNITVIVITHQMSVVESICKHVAILDNGEVAEFGDVETVFSHPKTDAARKLVFPDAQSGDVLSVNLAGQRLIRVVYNGADATGKPVVTSMAVEKGITASIVYASSRTIGDKVYGSMILAIPGGDEEVDTAIEYITQNPDVVAEEVTTDAV